MLQALWSASSGMLSQQLAMDSIANNLANVNTTGYKKSRVEFQDLLYSEMRAPGKKTLRGEIIPTGFQTGNGVRPAGTPVIFGQGIIQQTDNPLDLAIEGNAFFTVRRPDGSLAYTRDGSFKLDAKGTLVTADGSKVLDENLNPLTFDSPQSLKIDNAGAILEQQAVGRIPGFVFEAADKLEKVEDGYFRPTRESGKALPAEQNNKEGRDLYFQVLLPDGKVAYTKETQVSVDKNGRLITEKGYPIVPEVYLRLADGSVTLDKEGNLTAAVQVGKLRLVKFVNPAGLNKIGSNMYAESVNSGAATVAGPADYTLRSSALEGSNVEVAEEMVNMIIANRAYELSSRSIRTSDEMLGMANQLLKR